MLRGMTWKRLQGNDWYVRGGWFWRPPDTTFGGIQSVWWVVPNFAYARLESIWGARKLEESKGRTTSLWRQEMMS